MSTIEALPSYLRKYCVEQKGDRYTPRDHAAWRYIMRQSRSFFKDHAVPIYQDGLRKTGITFDRIPLIAEMDARLRDLGWGAVPVCGFIPPAAFLDFQARKVLPIAYDMRSVDHIAYTPAPDIVHEAAGHAPIIADREYAAYLTMYAAMAQKAIFSREDLDLYEAIRALSDIKENPDSTKAMIDTAEKALAQATSSITFISEAAKVARMNWWTVEYGLVGSLAAPKIYGAGLLSSVGESQACLTPKVQKIRLSVACVDQSYDITEPQPQLFVAEDIGHLVAVLKEFESSLSYKRGGEFGLATAKRAGTVTTTRLDSGLEISGVVDTYELNKSGDVEFVRWAGPVQLAHEGVELKGQGVAHHAHGFSTPLGQTTPLPLGRHTLQLPSGFVVQGEVVAVDHRVVKWRGCKVTRGDKLYFDPSWGDFDMALGGHVTSVYGGPADRERYGLHDVGQATTTPGRTSPFTEDEKRAFEGYAAARPRRGAPRAAAAALRWAEDVARDYPDEWLLRLEALEVAHLAGGKALHGDPLTKLTTALRAFGVQRGGDEQWLIEQGLALAAVPD